MDEPVGQKPLSWDLHVDHSTRRVQGVRVGSFLQQLMARQTGPIVHSR